MNSTIYRSLKMSIGFTLSLAVASLLHLDFVISAGVITMLNLLDSKIESAKAAWRKLYTAAIGLVLAMIVFSLFGYTVFHLGLFLLLFIPITIYLGASETIIVNTVLASHLLGYHEITPSIILNEMSLVIIGAAVTLIMNLHMPNYTDDLKKAQTSIEEKIRTLLWTMSMNIRNLCTIHDEAPNIDVLSAEIKEAKRLAYVHMNNRFLSENNYFLEYFQMRQSQLFRLQYMREHLDMVFVNQEEAMSLSRFTGRLAYEYDADNDGTALKSLLSDIRNSFGQSELPQTHFEFENRAALFQYLNDLEEFIDIKIRFSEKFPTPKAG